MHPVCIKPFALFKNTKIQVNFTACPRTVGRDLLYIYITEIVVKLVF